MGKLCIYHANCADGFGAAWAMRKAHPNTVFHPGVYQDPPPPTKGHDVYMVDFAYKAPVVQEIARTANSVTVLDHHKSAYEDLGPLLTHDVIQGVFDLERSGAMITWGYFHPGVKPPPLLAHIQDRDLWQFKLHGTREIQAALFSYPYDFDVWDRLMDPAMLDELYAGGCGIERKHHKDIAELVKVCERRMVIAGHNVPVASLPYTMVSDAAHLMAQDEVFAACYWDTPDGRVFGLRSTGSGMDVSEIAKAYGGGGHKHAARFRVSYDVAATMEVGVT